MTDKKIVIDASKCEWRTGVEHYGNYECMLNKCCDYNCDWYKRRKLEQQLKAKEQECKELKIYIESNEQQVKEVEMLVMDNDRLINELDQLKAELEQYKWERIKNSPSATKEQILEKIEADIASDRRSNGE